jgi:hypothetical protein
MAVAAAAVVRTPLMEQDRLVVLIANSRRVKVPQTQQKLQIQQQKQQRVAAASASVLLQLGWAMMSQRCAAAPAATARLSCSYSPLGQPPPQHSSSSSSSKGCRTPAAAVCVLALQQQQGPAG